MDQLWVAEAHDRLDAYYRGELEAVSSEEVFEEIERLLNDAVDRDTYNNAEGVG